jgi:transcriptional regulator with XRE-family HTH domain
LIAIAENLNGLTALDRYIMEKVKERRKELKITQFDLSVQIGKNEHFVGHVESQSDRAKYNLSHLNEVAKVFNCSIKDFLPDRPL